MHKYEYCWCHGLMTHCHVHDGLHGMCKRVAQRSSGCQANRSGLCHFVLSESSLSSCKYLFDQYKASPKVATISAHLSCPYIWHGQGRSTAPKTLRKHEVECVKLTHCVEASRISCLSDGDLSGRE
jgi:hypothetical protein